MPSLLAGAPFPFKIVLGIDDAVLPAALTGAIEIVVSKKAIAKRMDRKRCFTGDLQVLGT
jgi:hypothetical protein